MIDDFGFRIYDFGFLNCPMDKNIIAPTGRPRLFVGVLDESKK